MLEPKECRCGAKVYMVKWLDNGKVEIPVEISGHPGSLLAQLDHAGKLRTVRVATAWERATTPPKQLRTPHWDACVLTGKWETLRRRCGDTPNAGRPQPGPCVTKHCPNIVSRRYGCDPASPLCDSCRADHGMPAMAEILIERRRILDNQQHTAPAPVRGHLHAVPDSGAQHGPAERSSPRPRRVGNRVA